MTMTRPGWIKLGERSAGAGQTVFHLHFHIIPVWEGKDLGRHGTGTMAKPDELAPIAAKIRAAI